MKFDYQTHTHKSLTVHEIRLSNTHTDHWQFMKLDYQIHTQIIDSSWNLMIKHIHKSLTVHEIRSSNTHTNHWQFMKFNDFSEFRNVITDSPRPHSRASLWRIAYENRYVTHPLIEIFGNATTFHHFETSINSIKTLSFFRQFELQDCE